MRTVSLVSLGDENRSTADSSQRLGSNALICEIPLPQKVGQVSMNTATISEKAPGPAPSPPLQVIASQLYSLGPASRSQLSALISVSEPFKMAAAIVRLSFPKTVQSCQLAKPSLRHRLNMFIRLLRPQDWHRKEEPW